MFIFIIQSTFEQTKWNFNKHIQLPHPSIFQSHFSS